jgi:hypothetical protein
VRQFLERLLDRLSNKDKAKSTLWMVSAAIFLAISGTIGIILLLCVPTSDSNNKPGLSQFSAPAASSPGSPPNPEIPVDHTSTLRFTAYIALGLVVFASVAYCGTQLGFFLSRRRTVRRLHQAIKSTDLEAAMAKLAHAPQMKPAGSLSADVPPPKVTALGDDFAAALRRVEDGTVAEGNVRSDRITALKIDSPPPVVASEIDGTQEVEAAVANWMKQRASQSNPSA